MLPRAPVAESEVCRRGEPKAASAFPTQSLRARTSGMEPHVYVGEVAAHEGKEALVGHVPKGQVRNLHLNRRLPPAHREQEEIGQVAEPIEGLDEQGKAFDRLRN